MRCPLCGKYSLIREYFKNCPFAKCKKCKALYKITKKGYEIIEYSEKSKKLYQRKKYEN